MRLLARALLVAAALGSFPLPGAAYVELSGVFVAERRCPAMDSIRRATNPGAVETVPGQRYPVRGLNKEGGDFVQVDIPGAAPAARWVDRA
jgi:ribonuclease T2